MKEKPPKKRKPSNTQKGKPKESKIFTELKDQEIAAKALETLNVRKCAEELGVHRNTVYASMRRALSDDQIREAVQRSRDRNIKMLGLCDTKTLSILKDPDPVQAGNQIRLISSIYKTFGVWKDEPSIQIQTTAPLQVVVEGVQYEFKASEADESFRDKPVEENSEKL